MSNFPNTIIKAPEPIVQTSRRQIFFGGSIEEGKADLWQDRLAEELADMDLVIFNPRRENWNSALKQSINEPEFRKQVEWELDAIMASDLMCFYIDPGTKSPITLFEMGLCSGHWHDMIVCCPDGFWRKGNVEIYSNRLKFPLYNNWNDFVAGIKARLAPIAPRVYHA